MSTNTVQYLKIRIAQLRKAIRDLIYIAHFAGNPLEFYDVLKRFTFQAIVNASVSVDSFFLLRLVSEILNQAKVKRQGEEQIVYFLIQTSELKKFCNCNRH